MPNVGRPTGPPLLLVSLLLASLTASVMGEGPTPPARQQVYNLAAMTDGICFICFLVVFVAAGRYRAALCLTVTAVYLGASYFLYRAFKASLGLGGGNIGELPINVLLLAAFVFLTGLGLAASYLFGLIHLRESGRMRTPSRLRRGFRLVGVCLCLLIPVAFGVSYIGRISWTSQPNALHPQSRYISVCLDRGKVEIYVTQRCPRHTRNGLGQYPTVFYGDTRRQWISLGCHACFPLPCGCGRRIVAVWLWLPFLGVLIPTASLWYLERPPRCRSRARGHCQECGYDLTGNESGRCPECGTEVAHERHSASGA
jgi:hypothetical protein